MRKRIGRNDPCPCGSGQKFKKCCQASVDAKDFQYRRWRQVEAGLIPQLLSFAFETIGPESISDAWSEFNDDAPDEDYDAPGEDYDPESPINVLFMPWFLFNWTHETMPPGTKRFSETTIAESFLSEHSVSPDEERFLVSAIRRPYSLCEVVELTPGVGITLFDLLGRVRYEVLERSASQTLKRGEIIYCATTHLDGITSNIGTGPYALRPTAKRDVLELRKWIIDESGSDQLTETHLDEFAVDIRGLYLDTLATMFRPPQLANTDNDPLLPQKVYFDLESPDKAFYALKDLAEGITEDELRADSELAHDLIVKAEIPWLGGTDEARKRLGGPVLLGTIIIENRKLIADVNSTRRAETIRRIIEERLGHDACYKTTLLEPIESEVEKMWAAAAGTAAGSSSGIPSAEWAERTETSGVISLDDAPPELRLRLEESARQHWIRWMDLPVPALNNMTPREAAKTEEGRDLLESLLLYYESHEDGSNDNLMRPDVAALRRELGMDV